MFWLKALSFTITTFLALIGLLYDFKDKHTKRLTVWGRISLTCIIVSFFVGIVAEKIEDDSNAAAAKAQNVKDSNLLERVSSLLASNGQLLITTGRSLVEEKATEETTQRSLKDVDRTLEAAGDTIEIGYSFRIREKNMKFFAKEVDDFLKKNGATGEWHGGQDTDISSGSSDSDVDEGTTLTFGPKSPIIPSGCPLLTTLCLLEDQEYLFYSRVPFTVTIWKSPQAWVQAIKQDSKQPLSLLAEEVKEAEYNFDPTATAALDEHWSVPNPAFSIIYDTPVMTVRLKGNSIKQSTNHPAVFRRDAGQPTNLLSALDFGGQYVLVSTISNQKVKFCSFWIKIGPRTIYVPASQLQKVESDHFGFQLPKDMTQPTPTAWKIRQQDNCSGLN